VVVAFSILSAAIALYFQSIYDALVFSGSLGIVLLLVPVIAALFIPKANTTACLASMGCGFSVWVAMAWLQDVYPADLFGAITAAVVLPLVARGTRASDPPRPLVDSDHPVAP